jgi:uncharacterized protein (DUF2147 family)
MTSTQRILRGVLLAFALCASAASAQSTDATFGVWAPDQNSHIRLSPCAEHGLCGEVVWVRDGADAAQRNAQGFRVEGVFNRTETGWRGGRIFLPTRNRAFRTTFTPTSDGRLRVRGCALRVVCETRYWTRVD